MARALDLRLKGRGFDARPFRFHVTTLGKLFTHVCLSLSSIIWYQSRGGDAFSALTLLVGCQEEHPACKN